MLLHVMAAVANLTCEEDLQIIREKRLGAIRNQILSKLNMTEPPPNPPKPYQLSVEMRETYNIIQQAFERDARAKSAGCVDDNYFARKVSLFVPQKTYYDLNGKEKLCIAKKVW